MFLLLLPQDALQARPEGNGSFGKSKKFYEESFDLEEDNFVINARSMIHDGDYVSEGDDNYSWLWTGPSPHFRLILPHVAGNRPRGAEICVPRAEQHSNLSLVAVQLNGWSDQSQVRALVGGQAARSASISLKEPTIPSSHSSPQG